MLKTLVRDKKRQDVPPEQDPRYMINVVTSERNVHKAHAHVINQRLLASGAIVNTP